MGEVRGLACLLENAGTVFALCWGLLARTARELDALVIGSLYDPGEDHGEFFVARGPEVLRAFWSNPRRTTRPYVGRSPLPCEALCPLSAPGGAGLSAALGAFGFPLPDYRGAGRLPGERCVTWRGDIGELLASDVRSVKVNEHVRAFMHPACRWPEPRVGVRSQGEEPA